MFLEYDDRNLDALATIIARKYQTLSYIGFDPEELREWVLSKGLSGIDRIVPVGKTATSDDLGRLRFNLLPVKNLRHSMTDGRLAEKWF